MNTGEPFFGRELEIRELGELLMSPDMPVVTITGIGGIGKTTLARRVLEEYRHEFKGGCLFLGLSELEHSGQLVPAILSAMGREPSGNQPEKRLLETLARTELLLVLDNFEHIVSAAPVVAALAPVLSAGKILITSRTRLGFPLEHEYRLGGIGLPGADGASSPSLQLFLSVYGSRDLSHSDMILAAEICGALAGVPLGIKLAASMCREKSIGEVHLEISGEAGVLGVSGKTGERRHRSLRAVFNYSWNHLTGEERRVFAALSVFRGSFTRSAAMVVVSTDEVILQSLQRKSLLELHSPGVYEFHPLVRDFSRNRFSELYGDGRLYSGAHARYHTELLSEMSHRLNGEGARGSMKVIEGCFADILAAVGYSVETGASDLLRSSMAPLTSVLMRMGNLETGRRLFRAAAESLREVDRELYLQAMNYLGAFLHESADYSEASRCLLIAAESSSASVRSEALLLLGTVEMRAGRLKQAEAYMTQALDEARITGDKACQAYAMGGIGDLYNHMHDFEKARYFLESAIEMNRSIGYNTKLYSNLITLSNLMYNHRKGKEALDAALEASSLACSLGGDLYYGLGEVSVASAMQLLGRDQEALEHALRSVESFRNIDSRWGLQTSCLTLGSIQAALGLKEESLTTVKTIEELALELGPTYNTMESLTVAGDIYRAAGNRSRALESYRKAREIALSLEIPYYSDALEGNISELS